jgi:hypothetical protein
VLVTADFTDVIVGVHVLAVVVAFGVVFSYPLFGTVGVRLDPRAIPWFHRMQSVIGRRLINPGLAVVLLAGIYLASKEHQWSEFYVQWGIGAVVVIGALGGAFMAPNEKRLAALAERDVAAAGAGEIEFSAEYQSLARRVALVGVVLALIVVATIFIMALHVGAS